MAANKDSAVKQWSLPMARKAAAALAVVPTLPGHGRPEPPAELDPVEQRVWREVIDALPGHWVDTAGQLVLRRAQSRAAPVCGDDLWPALAIVAPLTNRERMRDQEFTILGS